MPVFRFLRARCAALPLALSLAFSIPAALASGGSVGSGNSGGGSGDAEVPGELLVKLKSAAGLQPLLAKYPLTLVDRFGARPIYRLRVIGNARAKDVLAALVAEPGVQIAETNGTHRSPEARKNVPWTIGSAQAYATQWAPAALHLESAHRLSTGVGVRVAVIDTGVDRLHPLLAPRLLPGFDFVDFDTDPTEVGGAGNAAYGHGTHVAGLIATVAPSALILPLRALDADGIGNAWVLAEALLHALDPDGDPATDDGAQVVNLSLGSLGRTRFFSSIAALVACESAVDDDPVADRSDPGYRDDAMRCTAGRGAVVVAAAGNDGSANVKQYPAAEGAKGLMAVGASNPLGRLATFSNRGSWVDLVAPGESITSAVPNGYGTWSGTSMAAPLVAGTAALLRALDPSLTPEAVVRRLKRTSAALCGESLRQIDPAAALANMVPGSPSCR